MTPNPRQALLLDEVRARGSVSVEALANQFAVTLQTVRRDLKLRSDAGLLARFHGGVRVSTSTTENIEYLQGQLLNEGAKQRIARAVAAAMPAGCSLIISIGTTIEVIVAGGIVRSRDRGIVGESRSISSNSSRSTSA